MSNLSGQQFLPGMEPEPQKREPYQRPDWAASVRPVGMRGSISDRQAVPRRQAASDLMKARWQSLQNRMADESLDQDEYDSGYNHPRTGLPTVGNIPVEDVGLEWSGWGNNPPGWATYHGSAVSAWTKHADIKEVPIPDLLTPQREVQAQRLHELIDNPEARSARAARGLPKELPRVYSEDGYDMLVDGNHRMSADILQGQMFGQARVAGPQHKEAFLAQRQKIEQASRNAAFNLADRGLDPQDVEDRMNDRMFGTGNW